MAEDDDDHVFGDFTFAVSNSNQFNNNNNHDDDDDWGDFVKSPQQQQQQQQLKPSSDFSSSNLNRSTSLPRSKPTGALPLSIFGEDVLEEEEEPEDSNREKTIHVKGFTDLSSSTSSSFPSTNNNNHVSSNSDSNLYYDPNSDIINKPPNGGFYYSSTDTTMMMMNTTKSFAGSSTTEDWGFPGGAVRGTGGVHLSQQPTTSSSNMNDLFSAWATTTSRESNNGFTSHFNTTTSTSSDINLPTTPIIDDDDDDDGEDEWEFKDADSGFQTFPPDDNADFRDHKVSDLRANTSGGASLSNKAVDLFGTSNGSVDLFAASTKSVDFFPTSNGISSNSRELDLVGVQPSTGTVNGFITETHSNVEQNNSQGTLSPSANVEETESDDDFGDFAVATETVSKPVEAFKVDVFPSSNDVESTTDGKIQDKDTKFNYHEGALPLSIFGYEEPENGGLSDVQDSFMHQSTLDRRHSHTATTVISVNDLISSLYSQAETLSPVNTVEKPTVSSTAVSSSNLVDDVDDLDDSSWDFKDASQTTFDTQASVYNIGDTHLSISSKLNLSNYVDFYSRLKEELCCFAKCHIESLKQARGTAGPSGEDAKVSSLDSELQLMCEELKQMNCLEESNLHDHPAGGSYLHELVEVLLEPQYQILESEYHLSQKLLQAEKDRRSTMELIRHTATMLKILTIGTLEEQATYISIWSEMVSVCTEELKHGASIWNQALEKHIENQLLSESQGREFVIALGEIYRVVVVIGASAKLFKPWALKSSAIYTLLENCHTVWSTSGLEEALTNILAETASDNSSLLNSIKYILGLDALALQSFVFAEKGSLCRLSILNEKVAPGMKMIKWEEEQCFVTLANVWTNLISRNPPKLPQLNLG